MAPRHSLLTKSLFALCAVTLFLKLGVSNCKDDNGNKNGHGNGNKHKSKSEHGHGNGKDADEEAKTYHEEKKSRMSEDDDDLASMFSPDMMEGGKDYKFKNNSAILDSPPEDDDEWEQERPLPRSDVLITAYFKMHEITPDIIPRSPKAAVEVTYADGAIADFGGELTQDQVSKMPQKTTWPTEKGGYYTLVLFSPDYPSRVNQSESQYVYWFLANIHDNCVVATGNTFTEYLSPIAVAEKSALHRFIYLVYKQPQGIVSYRMPYTTEHYFGSRKHFNVSEFAHDYNLGIPVAGNFFQMKTIKPDKAPKREN